MRNTIIILLVAVFAAGAGLTACSASTRKTETETETETAATIKKEAQHKKVNSGAVTDLIREYNLTEGFEAVSVGGLGLGLIRMIANASASIRQMSGQVSRGSAGEYQSDEWAGVARLSWRVSFR